MAQTPEPSENLMERLQAAQFQWPADSNQWIIPTRSLETLVDLHTVTAELIRLSASSPMHTDDLRRYATEICPTRKRLFALLLCGWGERARRCCKIIRELIDEGIADTHLPFERVHLAENNAINRRSRPLCIAGHANCKKPNCHCVIKAFENWTRKEIDDFLRDQWMVLSPVFEKYGKQIPHYTFDDRILLPFTEDYERTRLLTGGYSEVWPVSICAGHQNLYESLDTQDKEPLLAIKRLFSPHTSDFENETEMLTALTNAGHNYLVELLATYKYKGKYHLLFPNADANLRTLWARIPRPQLDAATPLWALDQMTGLTSGLVAIHTYQSNMAFDGERGNQGLTRFRDSVGRNLVMEPGEAKFGRHGDLKAENILWFRDPNHPEPSGKLQITDFGLGHFHRLESRSRQDPRRIHGSATYIPPEIPLNQRVSRKYDIWSLGCLFLEFATWLVEGTAGLKDFGERRMERAPDGINDDTFYSLISDRAGAVIRRGILEWIEHLKRSPRCSNMVRELLTVLQDDLLVVQPGSRIQAEDLYMKLKGMLQKSKDSSEYLMAERR